MVSCRGAVFSPQPTRAEFINAAALKGTEEDRRFGLK
jgi:hypothetical protein